MQLYNFNGEDASLKQENVELVRLCLRATPAFCSLCRLPPSPERLPSSCSHSCAVYELSTPTPRGTTSFHLPFLDDIFFFFFFFLQHAKIRALKAFQGEQQGSAILGPSSPVQHRSARQWVIKLSLWLIKIAEKNIWFICLHVTSTVFLISLSGCF